MDNRLEFSKIYNDINNNLNNFGVLGGFSIKKRQLLIQDAESIINFISTGVATSQQIEQLKALQIKLLDRSQGGGLSNFCLGLIRRGQSLRDLKDRTSLINYEIKKINKLLKAKVKPDLLPQFCAQQGLAKDLASLVFEDHLYEKMKAFGHDFTFNEAGEVTFKFTKRTSLDDEILEIPIDQNDEDLDEFFEDLHQDFVDRGLSLEIRGEFENGYYQTIPVSQITAEQLEGIIVQEDGSFDKSIQVIYPTQHLTLNELDEAGVLDKDEETGEYFVDLEYQYLDSGFNKYSESDWQYLRPITSTNQPPKDFTIDIIVHSESGLPGVLSDQGHVSIKMTTPQGEIYSIGLFPETSEGGSYNLSLQRAKLIIPDYYVFIPSTSYEQRVMTYTLSDPKSFHKLVKWIEATQGYHQNEETGEISSCNLFYHPTHQNCASFADTFRDYALQLGAKSEKLATRKISDWTRLGIRIKEALLNFTVTSYLGRKKFQWDQGIEHAGIKNFNITHLDSRGVYLPVDLILDHQKLTR